MADGTTPPYGWGYPYGANGSALGNSGITEGLLLGMLGGNRGYGGFGGYGYGNDGDMQADLARQIAESVTGVINATQAQNLAAIQATNAAAQAAQAIATETRADINRIEGAIELAQSQSESRLGSAIQQTAGDTKLSQSQSESRLGSAIMGTAGDVKLAQSQSEGRISSAVEINGGDTRSAVERNGSDTRTTVDRNGSAILQSVGDNASELRRDILDGQGEVKEAIYQTSSELRLLGATNHAASLLEIERAKFATVEARRALERQSEEHLGRIQLEAAKNVSAVLLETERTKYQLTKQMEECCCELKERIMEDGGRTRALIEKNEVDRLREALEHARRETDHHRHALTIQNIISQRTNTGTITNPVPPVA